MTRSARPTRGVTLCQGIRSRAVPWPVEEDEEQLQQGGEEQDQEEEQLQGEEEKGDEEEQQARYCLVAAAGVTRGRRLTMLELYSMRPYWPCPRIKVNMLQHMPLW